MRVLSYLVEDHNFWLVGLAAVVCVVGSAITMNLFEKLRASHGASQTIWMLMGGVAGGATIWCTHFIAVLAWQPSLGAIYDFVTTALSLLAAIAGATLSLRVAAGQRDLAPAFGGAVLGLTVSVMHYIGMMGLHANAFFEFDFLRVNASVVLSTLLGLAAFAVSARSKIAFRRVWASILMVLSIVSLHFTGMSAIEVTPVGKLLAHGDAGSVMLGVGVAAVGMLMLGSSWAAYALQNQAHKRERRRLQALLDGSVDGVAVEFVNRIVMLNKPFAELTGEADEDILGHPVSKWLEDAQAMTKMSVIQSRMCRATGECIPVEVSLRKEIDETGNLIRIYSARDLRHRLEQERRIAFLASNDSLTGMPNRAAFLEKLDRMCQLHTQEPGFALLAIDLNRFKDINDIYGHSVGDQLLVHISQRVKEALLEGEFMARLGGDEFIAIAPLSGLIDPKLEAEAVAKRLRGAIMTLMQGEHTQLGCGASIGIALWPRDASEPTKLINNADLAMYRAKAAVGDEFCFYDRSMDEAVRERRCMTQGIREALENNQFQIFYQPQVLLGTGEVTGYEALIRWRKPDGTFVSPEDFIPLAENTGLIVPIGEWVLRQACLEAVQWEKPLRLAVNLSSVQLNQPDLPALVRRTLMETGLDPARLELEITETAMISDMARSTHVLNQLKAIGVSIAMDDFGTGYSSLSTLRAFPFDKIKLDRAFMEELEESAPSRAIIRAVLTLGESLNIPVLAEGVETCNQLEFLRTHGCDEAQGYLLGRPAREVLPVNVNCTPDRGAVPDEGGKT